MFHLNLFTVLWRRRVTVSTAGRLSRAKTTSKTRIEVNRTTPEVRQRAIAVHFDCRKTSSVHDPKFRSRIKLSEIRVDVADAPMVDVLEDRNKLVLPAS